MRYVARVVLAVCCAAAFLSGSARAERKVALVIGNSLYGHHAALPNVPNDAAAMAALFKGAGFDGVDVRLDLGMAAVRGALRDFAGEVATADVAVLFYAGHGIEVGGTNYLIPVDARLATDYDVKDETVELDRVLEAMAPAKRLRLVLLDACRENPFVKGMKRTVAGRDVGRGLSRFEPPVGNTLIAFATKPNAIALDGKGPNSPFTAALVKHLATPGHDLRLALGDVRDDVLASTGGRQEPYLAGSLGSGIFAIVSGTPKASPAALPGQMSEVERAWASAKDSTSLAVMEAFRLEYGAKSPFYARLAEARIADLKKQHVALAVPPPAPKAAGAPDPRRASVPLSAAEERSLKPKESFKECQGCPEMVVVPAGSFTMGSNNEHHSEKPPHRVTIARPFAVGKFEVTFAEWEACVAGGGCTGNPSPGDQGWGRVRRPVIHVSWNDAKEYVAWLSRKTGKTYRLLSEAEWEYAARAGTTTRYAFGDVIYTSHARFSASSTVDVGSFSANAFGLHDMHGNVSEWVEDAWHDNYQGAPLNGSVWPGGNPSRHVARGGSWFDTPDTLRSSDRYGALPSNRHSGLGFRVARTL